MAKFMLLWELDTTKIPMDPKERMEGYIKLLNMAKEDLERGLLKDWGEYPGKSEGYCIVEGTVEEVFAEILKYDPYINFWVHPILSIDQVLNTMKSLSQT